jgi:hypothetical protein
MHVLFYLQQHLWIYALVKASSFNLTNTL